MLGIFAFKKLIDCTAGIGTYVENQDASSGSGGFFTRFKSRISSAVDQAIGTTFESHLIAGYQFIMRYWSPGDAIYIFGFSRGAYTARFLAEMVHSIGLLSQGNEEMVKFAWSTFSEFQKTRGKDPLSASDQARIDFMAKFKETFCREGCSIHFLGLFDCVNSVGQFEIPLFRKSYRYIANPPATHIRHAISIHERRLKFKPALFSQDHEEDSDILEVWFAGNHGDVGGGWGIEDQQQRLLSDTPLAWMVQEIINVPNTPNKLAFQQINVDWTRKMELNKGNLGNPVMQPAPPVNSKGRKMYTKAHDVLKFGGGVSWFATAGWWIIEILPFFTRLELENGEWVPRYWPPNMGAARDVSVFFLVCFDLGAHLWLQISSKSFQLAAIAA